MAQQCPSCSSTSPDGAKFCAECGTPFARACPACGTPAGAGKFCSECGTPLTAAAAPPQPAAPAPVSERRTTSVLFGDLVSFTTISESRDPEEVRELLSAYFAVARTVVGRYGGTIEKFIGDAVMAVWGVPVAHEDDAERSVRAGLDLVAEVAALGASVGVPDLSMRAGVVTGSVAVTLGATNEGMVAGDAVNTAARVQSAAEPGTVWTDSETRSLTAAAIAYTDTGEHALKGKAEPVRLFRADAVVAARGGAQRIDGLEAPLTGRDAELRSLKEQFHATEGDGRARLVLLEGEAGTGKSRLGWEFEKYVDGLTTVVRWHRGRCLSYGEGIAFWAFAEMVRSRLGLLESDDRAAVASKVDAGVRTVAGDSAEAAWLAPRVGALLTGAAGFDRTDLFSAWSVFLERVAEDRPLVLLFEDMQHADGGLLDLVDYLLETCRARLLVLVLARPDLRERRPSLGPSARNRVLRLDPLPDAAMQSLVDGLVADLPARARAALVSRAEGMPLYAVETVRSLIDREAVVASGGRYVFVDHDHTRVDLDQLAAPTSLQTLIAARLDALTAIERRVVQDASVLGLSFRAAGLARLSDTASFDLDVALLGLVRKGVVETVTDPSSPELGSYRFLQALVREVAYSTLARKDRRTRHLAAADHLSGEEGAEVPAGIVAQHLLDALEASSATDPDRPPLRVRARGLLRTAAERAEALGSPGEALHSCRAALALDPPADELPGLQTQAARVAIQAGEYELALELAQAAGRGHADLGRPGDAAAALAVVGRALLNLGRNAEAVAALRPVLDELTASGLHQDALLQLALALSGATRGTDPDLSLRSALLALRLAEEADDAAMLVRALNRLSISLADYGSPTADKAITEVSISLAREHHLPAELATSLANYLSNVYRNDLTRAGALTDEALSTSRRVGDVYGTEVCVLNVSLIWLLDGSWDRLEQVQTDWYEARAPSTGWGAMQVVGGLARRAVGGPVPALPVLESDEPYEHGTALLHAALLREQDGDLSGAADLAEEGIRCAFGDPDNLDDFEVLWSTAVELVLRAGQVERAERLLSLGDPLSGGRAPILKQACEARLRGLVALAMGGDPEALLARAEQELAAYGAPFLLARTRLELGRWLVDQGRGAEADPLLTQARTAFEQLAATPSLAELDALRAVATG